MNIFVALYTIVAFAIGKGVWLVGAWYIGTKALPFLRSLDLSIFKSEEEVAATEEEWF